MNIKAILIRMGKIFPHPVTMEGIRNYGTNHYPVEGFNIKGADKLRTGSGRPCEKQLYPFTDRIQQPGIFSAAAL